MSVNYIAPFFDSDVSAVVVNDLSLLYIEEDNILKTKVTSFLSDVFKNVETSSTGKDALSKFVDYSKKESSFDMVLIDSKIKDMYVIDLIQKIKTYSPDTPCILITDETSPFLILQAINIDVTHFLIKPLQIYKLVYTLKKAYCIKYYKNMLAMQ